MLNNFLVSDKCTAPAGSQSRNSCQIQNYYQPRSLVRTKNGAPSYILHLHNSCSLSRNLLRPVYLILGPSSSSFHNYKNTSVPRTLNVHASPISTTSTHHKFRQLPTIHSTPSTYSTRISLRPSNINYPPCRCPISYETPLVNLSTTLSSSTSNNIFIIDSYTSSPSAPTPFKFDLTDPVSTYSGKLLTEQIRLATTHETTVTTATPLLDHKPQIIRHSHNPQHAIAIITLLLTFSVSFRHLIHVSWLLFVQHLI